MPNQLQKSLTGYLSKIKKETGKLQLSSSHSFSSSKNWVLAGVKHPKKKLTFSLNHRRRPSKTRFYDDQKDIQESGHEATLSDIDRFLEENFKSLCIRDGHEEDNDEGDRLRKDKAKKESDDDSDDEYHHRFERRSGLAVYDSPKLPSNDVKSETSDNEEEDEYRHRFERTWGAYNSPKPSPDLQGTERLSPPRGSWQGSPSMDTISTSRSNSSTLVLPENCIAMLRHTDDPQEDFKLSMVEMMESKLGMREKEVDWDLMEKEVEWDLMEELLFCYLDLNDKKSHKFILSAFVDLIIALRDKEKMITKKGIVRSLSTRAARERLRKRMIMTETVRN